MLRIIVFKLFCNNWRFLHLNKRWCSLKGASHVTQFEEVVRSYFDLCAGNRLWLLFSLNIFLIIFELVCFSWNILCLSVDWSIFGTIDLYLQETSPSQRVSQILRESALLLALAVAKLTSYPLIIFWAACTPTFTNLSASSFWVIPQCAGEYVTLKEKHFKELLVRIPLFCHDLSPLEKKIMALIAAVLSLNLWIVFALNWDWTESICVDSRRIGSIFPWQLVLLEETAFAS